MTCALASPLHATDLDGCGIGLVSSCNTVSSRHRHDNHVNLVDFGHAQIYDRLQVVAANLPVAQQQDGSYMTAFSLAGFQ